MPGARIYSQGDAKYRSWKSENVPAARDVHANVIKIGGNEMCVNRAEQLSVRINDCQSCKQMPRIFQRKFTRRCIFRCPRGTAADFLSALDTRRAVYNILRRACNFSATVYMVYASTPFPAHFSPDRRDKAGKRSWCP